MERRSRLFMVSPVGASLSTAAARDGESDPQDPERPWRACSFSPSWPPWPWQLCVMNLMKAWNPMKSVPSLTGGTLIPSYPRSRDGERKSKRESENAASLPMSSTGKPVMTTDFANAMPWSMDTTLPTIAISSSAQGANETGESLFLSRAWCLVLYSFAIASLNYIDIYKLLVYSVFLSGCTPLYCPQMDK